MKRLCAVATVCVALLFGAGVMAAGDAAKGEAAAKGCTCHKSKGDLNAMAPEVFVKKMQDFKAGNGNKGMVSMAGKLTDEDFQNLAAYYAGLPKK